MMLFKTADWDDSTQSYNALATETAFLSYQLFHEFNRPARCTVVLSDPDGNIAKKYDVDAAGDSVYVGPGRAYIEDPTGVAIFEGRILRAVSDMKNHRVRLECEDWLSQLADDRIVYDMREDLDGSGLRQSENHADPNNTLYVHNVHYGLYSAQAKDGAAYNDETEEANEATTNDMTLLPAAPAITDAYYFGFETQITSFSINISTAGAGNWTLVWQYWDGDSWETLAGISDGTNRFRNGGTTTVSWTLPGDWATVDVNGVTCYYVRAYMTSFTSITAQPLGAQVWAEIMFWDDDMTWGADTYKDKYLVLTGGMAGSQTIGSGPYDKIVTEHNDGIDTDGQNQYELWYKNGIYDNTADNDSDYEVDYYFRFPFINSSLFTAGSISEVRLRAIYRIDFSCNGAKLQIDDATDGWITLVDALETDGHTHDITITIPPEHISDIFSATGEVIVRFDIDYNVATACYVDYLWIEIDCETTGYSSAITINHNTTNKLIIGTDLTAAATRVWEGCPYSIAQPIYKHLDTGESVGLSLFSDEGGDESGTGPDPLMALTAAATVEHTTGISLRHYHERTRLEIVQDLARQDRAVFWVTLGGRTVTYKSTFTNGAPTALTDASVLHWTEADWNYKSMFNEVHAYGARIGDHQLTAEDTDATSQATYGVARTMLINESGVFTQYDCTQLADKLVTQNKDVRLYLQAEIGGLSTLRLGDEVSITSSYLGLTTAYYTVTHWVFDSESYRTTIRLHPRASATGYQENVSIGEFRRLYEQQIAQESDKYIAPLTTQEWS